MKERINEFIKQSYVTVQSPSGEGYTHFSQEKFAELIVRECAKSIEKTIEVNCDTDDEKMGCEFAITDLLEHFGVEEWPS
jgi:hypothetical protein